MSLPRRLWTIGHSTHPVEAFAGILRAHGIEVVADVRLLPGSKRYPHFNAEALSASLSAERIEYISFPELGGRRKPRPDSTNTTWRNAAFRGYADYMETAEFSDAIQRLEKLADEKRTVVMCAEALWWKCHRALISDLQKARGAEVVHILSESKTEAHPYTSAARIIGGELSYRDSSADATQRELWKA